LIEGEPNPYYQGGYTDVTDTEGNRHHAKNVGSFAEGGWYDSASLGVVGERGSEWVAPNWMVTSPDYADTISQLDAALTRGYARGGMTSSALQKSSAPVSTSTAQAGGMADMTAMTAAIDRNTAMLEMLMSGGITARGVWEWETVAQGIYTMEEIDNANYFGGARRPGQRI
jgi:hypothetical protein